MARKTDHNQSDIVAALRKMGATVVDLHTVGRGCPDIAVSAGYPARWFLCEIKNGSRVGWKLTDAQKKFRVEHRAAVYILDSVDMAVEWVTLHNKPAR